MSSNSVASLSTTEIDWVGLSTRERSPGDEKAKSLYRQTLEENTSLKNQLVVLKEENHLLTFEKNLWKRNFLAQNLGHGQEALGKVAKLIVKEKAKYNSEVIGEKTISSQNKDSKTEDVTSLKQKMVEMRNGVEEARHKTFTLGATVFGGK
jgi:hypothetical protein